MTNQPAGGLENLGRFTEQALLILVSLSGGPRHGYAIIEDIEALTRQRLGAGTLYGAIARLEARNLIVALAPQGRRKPYQLTSGGRAVLEAKLSELAAVVGTGRQRLSAHGAASP